MNEISHYIILLLIITLINLPFGYWRQGTKKFSFYWVLFIHGPVPIVIGLRHMLGIDLNLQTAPLLFGAYFLGQYLGKHIRIKRNQIQA